MEHILGIVSMAWMYLTPIVYSKSIIPVKYHKIFNLNPMTPIIDCYRTVLYDKQVPDLSTLLIYSVHWYSISFKSTLRRNCNG